MANGLQNMPDFPAENNGTEFTERAMPHTVFRYPEANLNLQNNQDNKGQQAKWQIHQACVLLLLLLFCCATSVLSWQLAF